MHFTNLIYASFIKHYLFSLYYNFIMIFPSVYVCFLLKLYPPCVNFTQVCIANTAVLFELIEEAKRFLHNSFACFLFPFALASQIAWRRIVIGDDRLAACEFSFCRLPSRFSRTRDKMGLPPQRSSDEEPTKKKKKTNKIKK